MTALGSGMRWNMGAVVLALAALGLSACGSDGGSDLGKSSAQTTPSSVTAPSESGSSGPGSGSTSASTGSAGGNAAACADLDVLERVNKQFDGVGDDIAKGKVLILPLQTAAAKLADDAPSQISTAASDYDDAVGVLATYVKQAKSVSELNRKSKTDPTLMAALGKLRTSTRDLEKYRTSSC